MALTSYPGLCECHGCGRLQALPSLPAGALAYCPVCNTPLRRNTQARHHLSLAWVVTACICFLVAVSSIFLDIDFRGRVLSTTLFTPPVQMEAHGAWELGILVGITVLLMPLLRLLALLVVLLGARAPQPHPVLVRIFAAELRIGRWAMTEVFLLGVFVAYTRLNTVAPVDVRTGAFALGALMLANVLTDASLDREAVWADLDPRDAVPDAPARMPADLSRCIACQACGLVSGPARDGVDDCPRCTSRLHRRKPNSLARCTALVSAAAIFYIPANLYPVMTLIYFGQGAPNTILGGVRELLDAQMWPLALLVFVASITIPIVKLVGLGWMLLATRRHSARALPGRTRAFRIIEAIGRWSMIDVFMISILVALLRMGSIASVEPGPGAIAFAAVVVLTMLASASFDPRLMWDAAPNHRLGPA